MEFAVMQAAGYVLVHTPDLMKHHSSVQILAQLSGSPAEALPVETVLTRTFQDAVAYAPNQVFIGNMTPEELALCKTPWSDHLIDGQRFGKCGEIMPQLEFYGLLKTCDAFDLIKIEKNFLKTVKDQYIKHPLADERELKKLDAGDSLDEIQHLIDAHGAVPLYEEDQLIGCVKRGHDYDPNLKAQVILENIACKATGVIAAKHALKKSGLTPDKIDYVIECSEEACGDINQRGGGNFAKSIAESIGAINATGSDLRGFCAAPMHALVTAASYVKAGTYDHVLVVAGGTTAKLGVHTREFVRKGKPVLDDVLGGFAIVVSKNDSFHPIIRTDLVGRHTVGVGSSPLLVMESLINKPLEKSGLTLSDIDRYSVEMQNSEITQFVGAGDIPESNYKMIAAIGQKRGELDRRDATHFMEERGLIGWAPTQGHIPAGVPYCGFAIHELTSGELNRVMLIGKGSLFLGRMTNLFDGISLIIERNNGEQIQNTTTFTKEDINQIMSQAMRGLAEQLLKDR